MKNWIRLLLLSLATLVVLAVGAFAAVIAFDSPKAPPVLAAAISHELGAAAARYSAPI